MKKLLALVLIFAFLLSGCGAEKIGTDYDFSKVAADTMLHIIEEAPNPGHSHLNGEWTVIIAARGGAEIPEGRKFCSECGAKVVIPEPEAAPADNVCPTCGAVIAEGKKFCGECGTKIEIPAAPAGPKHCSGCGAEIPEGRKFCSECGAKVE